MRREELEHVLRAASAISHERDMLIIGSQSILAAIPESLLPAEATSSVEVDIAFFDDAGDVKADVVDGAIGEMSPFHDTFGYYAQGVGVGTAILPAGRRERLVVLESASTAPGRGLCLEPHDCVLSKLAAGREKDYAFATALVHAGLVDPRVLATRVGTMAVHPVVAERIRSWCAQAESTAGG